MTTPTTLNKIKDQLMILDQIILRIEQSEFEYKEDLIIAILVVLTAMNETAKSEMEAR